MITATTFMCEYEVFPFSNSSSNYLYAEKFHKLYKWGKSLVYKFKFQLYVTS